MKPIKNLSFGDSLHPKMFEENALQKLFWDYKYIWDY